MVTSVVRRFQNQYAAAFAGSLSMMVSGACFVWATPVLPLFNGKEALIPMSTTEISWMISLIELGSLFSPALAGYLSEKLGRKPAILVAGPFIIIGWILILVTRDALSLFIVRILHGFGMGVLFTIVPIYLGEIAAVNVRGGLTSLLQTMWYTGFLFQYVVGSYLSYDNSAWVNLIFSSAVFVMFFLLQPETPFYLIMKNKEEKANNSLMLLRGKTTFDEIATEIKMIKDTVEKDMKSKFKWSDLFNLSKVDIRVILIVQVLALFRLCSGTISISAYLSELLREADWDFISPELTMTIYSCVTLVSIIIAMVVVDHVGRRPLLLLSCAATAVSSLSLSIFYWINDFRVDIDLDSYRWFPTVGFITFTMFFAIGLGPVTQIMQSELFPMNIRALGNVITSYNLTFASFVCLRFYQIMVDNFGIYSNFLFFAISSLTGLYVIYMYVPETKGKTFLEISEYFSQKANKTKSNDNSNA